MDLITGIADLIFDWSLNVAVLAGALWVLLRFLEQAIKVWRLLEEDDPE